MTLRSLSLIATVSACSASAGELPRTRAHIEPDPARELTVDQAIAELWPDTADVRFAPTTLVELAYLDRAIGALWRDAAAEPGARFAIERWRVGQRTYVVLRESADARRGAGSYVFRADGSGSALLEAPHAYYDLRTGEIAARVFFDTDAGAQARALFTNSMHRYQRRPGERTRAPNGTTDLSHNPEHGFTAATAITATAGAATVIQLHGFGADAEVDGAAAVVSAGDALRSSARSDATAYALANAEIGRVARFPEDTRALGATTNAQGRALAGSGAAFVHVELSRALRDRLLADRALLSSFADAVLRPSPP